MLLAILALLVVCGVAAGALWLRRRRAGARAAAVQEVEQIKDLPPPDVKTVTNVDAIAWVSSAKTHYGRCFMSEAAVAACAGDAEFESLLSRHYKFASIRVHPDRNSGSEGENHTFRERAYVHNMSAYFACQWTPRCRRLRERATDNACASC